MEHVRAGERILDAARRLGYECPQACRNGVCHVCAALLVEGRVQQAGTPLELYQQPEQFCAGITEDSPYLRKLRRRTPFVGILTEQERQQALQQQSLGTLTQVLTGF